MGLESNATAVRQLTDPLPLDQVANRRGELDELVGLIESWLPGRVGEPTISSIVVINAAHPTG